MGKVRQTLERRQLGLRLRRLRESRGHTQQEAADAIRKVRSRIVDLEDGRSTVRPEDLAKLLDLYNATPTERSELSALAAQAAKRRRRQSTSDVLPDAFDRFAELEATAVEICAYELGIIPGLLQSPAYIRALLAESDGVWWDSSAEQRSERAIFREERQQRVLESGGPSLLRFVIGEDALRAVVGGPDVMSEQFTHVLRLTAERPGLTIQVLPSSTPGNPARTGGFALFHFGARNTPVAFTTPVHGPDLYYDDVADTRLLERCFAKVTRLALPPEASSSLIKQFL
jgi:transcriptional regulator with XRE-family HTH domain